jgi:hypothetical protein
MPILIPPATPKLSSGAGTMADVPSRLNHTPRIFKQFLVSRLPKESLQWPSRIVVVQRKNFPRGKEIFLFCTASSPVLGPTHFPIHWLQKAFYSRLKRPGHEADHSPPSSVEIKNGGTIHPLPHTSSQGQLYLRLCLRTNMQIWGLGTTGYLSPFPQI